VSLRLTLLSSLPAGALRRAVLKRLARATADAFETAPPAWGALPFDDRLSAYADFTAAEAGRLLGGDGGDSAPADSARVDWTKERLHDGAAALGSDVRRGLGVRRPEEALQALQLLYGKIGIDVKGRADGGRPGGAGGIEVTRCFFAGRYTAPVCRLMSAFDAGVVDGLFGGASLEFSQRMTEGDSCCRAVIKIEGAIA
jgi:hypothetical protein